MTEQRPTLIIVAGPNGSGKSSVTAPVQQQEWAKGCEYINPDIIAKEVFGDHSLDSALAAAELATERREWCLRERKSLMFETVFSAPDKLDFVERAKDAGYFVRMVFVGTDGPHINVARVAIRVEGGGHPVPEEKISSRYTKSLENAVEATSNLADRAYFFDNSIDDELPRLMFRTVDGELAKVYSPINAWAMPLALELNDGREPPLPSVAAAHSPQPEHASDIESTASADGPSP